MRVILIICATLFALLIANWLFWHLVGILLVLAWLAFLGACAYGIFLLAKSLLGKKNRDEKGDKDSSGQRYKLWTPDAAMVSMFTTEPSSKQIMLLALDAHDSLKSSDVVEIPIDTRVIILEDTGKECIKVRLKDGTFPNSIGWVARNSLIKESN
jgi:hypothetical protein